jgi:hypothetical protein
MESTLPCSRSCCLVVVLMSVPPGPVFFLLLGRQPAEVAIRVAVVFVSPAVVEDDFVVVPDVVVAVIGIIDPVVMMMGASHAQEKVN